MALRLTLPERLRRTWQEAIEHNKKREAWPTIVQARKLFIHGAEEEALEFLETAAQRFPDDAEIRLLYGSILLATRPEDRMQEAKRAVELAPDEPIYLIRVAWMTFRMEPELSRDYAARAQEMGGADSLFAPELIQLEAHFSLEDGDEEGAEARFRAALEGEPENGDIALDLATFMSDRGRRSEALEVVERVLPIARWRKDDLTLLKEDLDETV
jgi:thioredoxin-like negative regulator of GroEL